ncbi:MAG: ABC transporter permease [Bacteroidetes bacterium]|nr:ABC transporter permease [Bacteroidota bacterium]
MMYLKLAWRNIWRNRRRTLITAASVFFAVSLAVLMRSLQHGAYDNMIRNAAGMYLGYVQVHHNGYWNDKSLNNTFTPDEALLKTLDIDPRVSTVVPRLESFALASSGNQTKTALVIGADPSKEASFTQLNKRITQGTYFSAGEDAALLGDELAKNLKLKVGDTLVLLGQGYHGYTAAGKYVIKGLIHFGSPDLNREVVYLPLQTAQLFYTIGNRLTSITLNLFKPKEAEIVARSLSQKLDKKYWEVMDWKQMMPQLEQLIQLDSSGGLVIIGILYLVIAFGVFGTILMMLAERQHEMGILTAIGMKPYKMGWMIFTELVLMVLLGVLAGIIASIPLVTYFKYHPIRITGQAAEAYEHFGLEPIFPFSTNPDIFISQGIVVLIICVMLSFYAWYKILRIDAVESMRM